MAPLVIFSPRGWKAYVCTCEFMFRADAEQMGNDNNAAGECGNSCVAG